MARTAAGNRLLSRTEATGLLAAVDIWSTNAAPPPAKIPADGTTGMALPRPEVTAKLEPGRADRSGAAKGAATPAETSLADRRVWPPQKLSLALQGGGSFAAFSWGVLDRLLEQPDCEFDAISGASAGAVNAVLLASGLVEGGRQRARARLQQFWARIMNDASFRSLMLVGGFSPAGSSVAFGPALAVGTVRPVRPRSAAPAAGQGHRFFGIARSALPKTADRGDPRSRRPAADFPQCGDHGRRGAGIDLSAPGPLHRRNRR